MKLAVGLLTCDRSAYTMRTLEAWAKHNRGLEAELLHADDGSRTEANADLARHTGFRRIGSSPDRLGQLARLRSLLEEADRLECDRFLLLENDWCFERSLLELPLFPDSMMSVRLYGPWKDKARQRASGLHLMGTDRQIVWTPGLDAPGWARGWAHWGGPPSITKTQPLLELARQASSFKDISLASAKAMWLTARPDESWAWHIGDETTPRFRP